MNLIPSSDYSIYSYESGENNFSAFLIPWHFYLSYDCLMFQNLLTNEQGVKTICVWKIYLKPKR